MPFRTVTKGDVAEDKRDTGEGVQGMEEVLYIKIEQNIPVVKREITIRDLGSLYCANKKVVEKL